MKPILPNYLRKIHDEIHFFSSQIWNDVISRCKKWSTWFEIFPCRIQIEFHHIAKEYEYSVTSFYWRKILFKQSWVPNVLRLDSDLEFQLNIHIFWNRTIFAVLNCLAGYHSEGETNWICFWRVSEHSNLINAENIQPCDYGIQKYDINWNFNAF